MSDRKVWVILADGDHDATGEGERYATKHANDLKRMGFEVKVKWFETWAEADAYEQSLRP